jgi:hypothetical protein
MKTSKLSFLLRGLVVLLIVSGCTPQPVPDVPQVTSQWYVSPTGNDANDCQTLNTPCQHIAVALERALENDFIHLSAGTFNENLVIKKSITILGEGRDETFLDGVTGSVIEIGNGEGLNTVPDINLDGPSTLNVTLSWFTIEKGNATDINKGVSGGGLYITDGTVNLNGISLFQNKASIGAGMFSCNYCTVVANDLIVRGNESVGAEGDNGAGGILNDGEMTLVDSLIEMNVTERLGGGITNGWNGNLILERVQFIHNLAGIAGGGILNVLGDVNMVDVDFQSNQAAYGGGILSLGPATVLIQSSDFLSNRATNFGGAIANMSDSNMTLVNVTLSSNQGLYGAGIANGTPADYPGITGIDISVPAVVNAYNLTFAYNQAPIGGGVYNLENGQINLINSLFVDNTAGSCIGSVTGDGNMSTDATCAFDGLNNFYDFNPLIESAPHQNGGITFTHALQPNSPAIDAGISGPSPIPTEDQRGYPRPTNGDGFGEARNDIGAYEADEVEATYAIAQPEFTPNNNANCRQGPGVVYGVSTFGTAGTSYPIQGISRDGFWYYIQFNESLRCWMSGDTGETSGDLGELPVMEAPPVAVERPGVVCTDITTYGDCASHSECQWIPLSDLLGYCTNK